MADTDRASEGESADGGGPSKAKENAHQIAARIAQAFRDAGVSAEVLDPAPATAFRTLVQRDRIVLALAITLLIAATRVGIALSPSRAILADPASGRNAIPLPAT